MTDRLPERIFDFHSHLHRTQWWGEQPLPALLQAGPNEVGLATYRDRMDEVLPGREVHSLQFAYPFPSESRESLLAANEWVAEQLAAEQMERGLLLVRPQDDPDWVREHVQRLGLRGLKPYHTYSPLPSTWEAEIPDYLPNTLMEAADEEGWIVVLHLVRSRGLADASNRYWVRRYCERYPDAQLVLAHCARGFNAYHVLEALPTLTGLPNLWVDTSGVCDALAFLAALHHLGPERLLYGSDFPVSHMRGTNFAVGDTFIWVDESSGVAAPAYAPDFQWPRVGAESLRALSAALALSRLSDSQVSALFWDNAAGLLGL